MGRGATQSTKVRDRAVSLAITVTGDAPPPSEFRIFSAGKVETTKGTFVFDDEAAKRVMADYEAHGIDLMIDYDHASLELKPQDPATASRAAGWFNLAVRNGELWAVNVRWTEPAAAALQRKEWRFMSPAFQTEDDRVVSLLNVAITNMPATRRLEPLMAASKEKTIMASDSGLSPKLVSSALEAVASKDAKGSLDLLKQILGALLGGADPDATTEDAPPPVGDGGADEGTEPAMSASDPEKKDMAAAAAGRMAIALTGKSDPGEAIAELARRSKVAVEIEARETKLAADRALLEMNERKTLLASFVKLGVETSHTSGLASGTIPKRLLEEPIEEMRERLKQLSAALPARTQIVPPAGGVVHAGVELTPAQLQICKETGADPVVYATLLSQRDSVQKGA